MFKDGLILMVFFGFDDLFSFLDVSGGDFDLVMFVEDFVDLRGESGF